ncbi:MAG: FkbM family methyltransferase [Pseudomonadota bacterium]|nr:FkbM family methyltransferase [Pseudomonadota bacterium]
MVDKINQIALEYRATLPTLNSFGIEQLMSLPSYYGWVECNYSHVGQPFFMFLGGNDDGVALRFFWNGSYERTSLKLWASFAKEASVIIDVGAHTGSYTLAALNANPSAKVLSFEPNFMNFGRLNLNIRANKHSTGQTYMLGVGERDERQLFSIPSNLDYLTCGGVVGDLQDRATITIDIVSLDSALGDVIESRVGLVKLDTEGYEAHCLRGMKSILSTSQPVIFFECINPESSNDMQDILSELGYHFYTINDINGEILPAKTIVPALTGDGSPVMHLLNRVALPRNQVL